MQSKQFIDLLESYYNAYVGDKLIEYKHRKWGNMKLLFRNNKNELFFINPLKIIVYFNHDINITKINIQNSKFSFSLTLDKIVDLIPDINNENLGLDFEKCYPEMRRN